MSKPHLVIVESPAKAKTINQYLGAGYVVRSSVGHIRRLEKDDTKGASPDKLLAQVGIKEEGGHWSGHFIIDEHKRKVVQELKQMASQCDLIYLASDLDREGEAIAWHLREVLGGDKSRYRRVVFNEITRSAIQQAFAHPIELNLKKVDSQLTRQFLDKLVGYSVSPVLWKKVQRGLSAGRVQSPAVKLVVEREQEIRRFIPEAFWEWDIHLVNRDKSSIVARLYSKMNKKLAITKESDAARLTQDLEGVKKWTVLNIQEKPTTSKPRAPFITSTLQQAASTHLGYGVKRTMQLAQSLYEAGYITYMRTDAPVLSQDAVSAIRDYLLQEYGKAYLPDNPPVYKVKGNAQEAHEGIRPSNITLLPSALKEVDEQAKRLYTLIRNHTLASQMTDAEYLVTTVDFQSEQGDYVSKVKGRVVVFDGWTKVLPQKTSEEDQSLPTMKVGETFSQDKVVVNKKYTKPPARFNEASLVKTLEKYGIGRPSTYATILTTIQNRGYVEIVNKAYRPMRVGEVTTDALEQGMPQLLDYTFTAQLEDKLDQIAEGTLSKDTVLSEWYQSLKDLTTKALLPEDQGGIRVYHYGEVDIPCPSCRRKLLLRYNKEGNEFLGCSGFTDKENPCKQTLPLLEYPPTEKVEDQIRCPHCKGMATMFYVGPQHALVICEDAVHCRYIGEQKAPEGKTFTPPGAPLLEDPDHPPVSCHQCGQPMSLRQGRFGRYYHCESCKINRGVDKEGNVLPPKKPAIELPELKCKAKGAYFVLRETADGGLFLGANKYPRVKEIRSIKVEEMVQVKEKLPQEYHYLTLAPMVDSEGNPTIVRFDKKNKERYVGSMDTNTGKPTRIRYTYTDGQWVLN